VDPYLFRRGIYSQIWVRKGGVLLLLMTACVECSCQTRRWGPLPHFSRLSDILDYAHQTTIDTLFGRKRRREEEEGTETKSGVSCTFKDTIYYQRKAINRITLEHFCTQYKSRRFFSALSQLLCITNFFSFKIVCGSYI